MSMPVAATLALGLCSVYCVAASNRVAFVPDDIVDTLKQSVQTNWTFLNPELKPSTEQLSAVEFYVPSFGIEDITSKLGHCTVYQLSITGYDRINFSAIPASWTIANVHQAGTPIAEYVLRNMLEWNIRQNQAESDFRNCTWRSSPLGNDCKASSLHKEISGQTVGIVGYGHIGEAIATRAAAFGVKVIAVDIEAQNPPPSPLAWMGTDAELPKLLKQSDFVVIAVPLLPTTTRMLNATNLKHMSNTSVLINIARGPVVNEGDLYRALQRKEIGGAVLDVWWHAWEWRNPGEVGPHGWPADFDFSKLENVVMTPHVSAQTVQSKLDAVTQVAANMDHFFRGEPLDNVVRNGTCGIRIV